VIAKQHDEWTETHRYLGYRIVTHTATIGCPVRSGHVRPWNRAPRDLPEHDRAK
jgi:hypothetical protein